MLAQHASVLDLARQVRTTGLQLLTHTAPGLQQINEAGIAFQLHLTPGRWGECEYRGEERDTIPEHG